EPLDERGLPNAGLAADEHETAVAGRDGAEEAVQFIEEMFALEQFHSFPDAGTSVELPIAGRRQMMLLKMRSRRVGLWKKREKRTRRAPREFVPHGARSLSNVSADGFLTG